MIAYNDPKTILLTHNQKGFCFCTELPQTPPTVKFIFYKMFGQTNQWIFFMVPYFMRFKGHMFSRNIGRKVAKEEKIR